MELLQIRKLIESWIKKIIGLQMIILCCYFCKKEKQYEEDIYITIEEENGEYFDLKSKMYLNNEMSEVKFELLKNEEKRIIDAYYDFEIDKIKSKSINDNCIYTPKEYTKIKIYNSEGEKIQEISIDIFCDDHGVFNREGKRVQKFVRIIFSIVKNKREVKEAINSRFIL